MVIIILPFHLIRPISVLHYGVDLGGQYANQEGHSENRHISKEPNQDSSWRRRTSHLRHNVFETLGHVFPAKDLAYTLGSGFTQYCGLLLREAESLNHHLRPGGGVGRGSQPAGLAVHHGLDGSTCRGSEDGRPSQHGLERDDAEVFLRRGIN